MDLASLGTIFGTLNSAGVVYVVVGGVAVIAHGHLRTTADLDLVIALDPPNCRSAMNALRGLGYHPKAPVPAEHFADPAIREQWIRDKGLIVFQLVSNKHPRCPIDVFVREPFPVADEFLHALRYEIAPDVTVPVVRMETLFTLKRQASRPIDLDDIEKLQRLRNHRSRS
jgi:hypothetical protein